MNLAVIWVLSTLATASSYHLLCTQAVPTRSHYNLVFGVVKALLKAGHEVTMITPYPASKPIKNLNFIDVSAVEKIMEGRDLSDRNKMTFATLKNMTRTISKIVVETPAVREALMKTQFDAVITEYFFTDIEAGYAAVQQVPWILLSPTLLQPQLEGLVDSVKTVSTIPIMFNDGYIPMNFKSRVMNSLWYILMTFSSWMDKSQNTADYESYFSEIAKARGVPLTPYSEAIYNVSILFANSHTSFAPAMSLPPNVIDIGGYHIDEEIPALPKDLQDLLDSSEQGVIYFSMGSAFKSTGLPEKAKRELVQLFGQLPLTVLWKYEETLENLPKNLHIRSWMPQSSILAHPNVKVFMTHGGLLSTLESLQYGVPLLAIPVFGDQPANAARAVREGHALQVEYSPEMAPDIKMALTEMLSNDKYEKRAKFLSKLFRDRPVHPNKLIQYYVELAIETKGAYHLRSKTHLYKWYEVWMIDQLVLLIICLYIIYMILKTVACKVLKCEKSNLKCSSKNNKKQKKH